MALATEETAKLLYNVLSPKVLLSPEEEKLITVLSEKEQRDERFRKLITALPWVNSEYPFTEKLNEHLEKKRTLETHDWAP